MAISKSSALMNQYKTFTLAVDAYQNKKVMGRIYHASREAAIPFIGLIDLVKCLETLFDEMHYPMPSMVQRRFKAVKKTPAMELPPVAPSSGAEVKGELLTLRLTIKHRYNASWQGHVQVQESGEQFVFASFLELVRFLDSHLDDKEAAFDEIEESSVCRVAVDEYGSYCMKGHIHQIASEKKFYFCSAIQIMRYMERMSVNSVSEKKVVTNQALGVYRDRGKKATFVIRLLFRENATWQGRICWKETSQTMNFRSFLELLHLMDAALMSLDLWKRDDKDQKRAQ